MQAFQGTICEIKAFEYLKRKLNGQLLPEVDDASQAENQMVQKIVPLMRLLTWQDFELLVDLVFANSGWRRLGQVGKTQKTVDIELMLPTTGERAFVQIKSSAGQRDLTEYLDRLGIPVMSERSKRAMLSLSAPIVWREWFLIPVSRHGCVRR